MSAHRTWVRPLDGKTAQEIREYLVSRRRLARGRLRPERGDPHLAHQPRNALAVDRIASRAQHRRLPSRAEERPGREQLVDPPHQDGVVVLGARRRPIDAGACKAEQRALPAHRQRAVLAVDELAAVRGAHRPDLLAKKSRSTMSWPILACRRSISRSRSAAASPLPLSNARAAWSKSRFFQA